MEHDNNDLLIEPTEEDYRQAAESGIPVEFVVENRQVELQRAIEATFAHNFASELGRFKGHADSDDNDSMMGNADDDNDKLNLTDESPIHVNTTNTTTRSYGIAPATHNFSATPSSHEGRVGIRTLTAIPEEEIEDAEPEPGYLLYKIYVRPITPRQETLQAIRNILYGSGHSIIRRLGNVGYVFSIRPDLDLPFQGTFWDRRVVVRGPMDPDELEKLGKEEEK